MAAQSFKSQATTPAQPVEAWKALQRPETWGTIGGVRRVESPDFDDDGNLKGYQFVVQIAGSEHRGTAILSSSVPGREMVMKIDSPQVTGQIEVALLPDDDGTRVSVDMSMSPNGFLAVIMFPVISKAVADGFDQTVATFVAELG